MNNGEVYMQNGKQKVLFFLYGDVGGAQRMTVNIGRLLPREQYEVKFVVCCMKTDICQFISADYEIIRIPWRNLYCFPRIRMARVILREKPDFVFSSHMSLNIRLLQVASFLKVKCIVRNDNMLSHVNKSKHKLMRKWYQKARYVIAQQDEMGEEMVSKLGLPKEKVKVCYNVIDTDFIDEKLRTSENPYPQNDNVKYICLNRFHPTKAQDITIKSFIEVHKENPATELYFVGHAQEDNPLVQEVKRMINQNHLQDSVHIIGYDSNPYKWCRYADCLVTTSRLEGLPNVLIEAQYLGTPAAATTCIPMVERIITEGVSGFGAPVDDIDAIAEAMKKAPKLGRIKMTYKPTSKEDFVKLFK